MIEKIKELRVQIDSLSQMTKGLNPFKWQHVEIPNKETHSEGETGIVLVREGSFGPPDGSQEKWKYHSIIDTDRGCFRTAASQPLDEKRIPHFDYNSREINKAYDSLMLAKAWLGKTLGSLGEKTPYANDGKRKEVSDIEPTADTAKKVWAVKSADGTTATEWKDLNHIQRVDWLREDIGRAVETLKEVIAGYHENGAWERLNCERYLSEARFWLGFELQRIKENR